MSALSSEILAKRVVSVDQLGGITYVTLSCGHQFTCAGLRTPQAGEPGDCLTCRVDAMTADDQTDDGLVWTRLPSGEMAPLKPDTSPLEDDDALYVATNLYEQDEIRHARAMEALFGPWPRVSETLEMGEAA